MLEQPVLQESRSSSRTGRSGGGIASPQLIQLILTVLGIAGLTLILFLYVLPNSQINAARLRIAELRTQKLALDRQNTELLKEISRHTDLLLVETRARQLGMGLPKQFLRVSTLAPAPAMAVTPNKAGDAHGQADVAAGLSPGQTVDNLRQVLAHAWTEVERSIDRLKQNFIGR